MSIEIEDVEMKQLSSDDVRPKKKTTFTGLTKEELMKIEREDKFWSKLRIVLFILFWVVWVGLLVASVVIVIVTPKCPYRPTMANWQVTCAYRLNPYAFKDSNNDRVGDLKGVKEKLAYVTDTLGAKTIILDPIFPGQFGEKYLHTTTDFYSVDPQVGQVDDIRTLAKDARKQGQILVLTMDINSIGVNSDWVAKEYALKAPATTLPWVGRNGKSVKCKHNGQIYYTSMGAGENEACVVVDLDYTNPKVVDEMKSVLDFWLSNVGVGGVLLTNAAFLVENFTDTGFKVVSASEENPFFHKQYAGQVFTSNSAELVKNLREVVDKANQRTSKKKLVIVESGDLGYLPEGESHPLLNYTVGADVVLLPHFLHHMGWKTTNSQAKLDIKKFYDQYDSDSRNIGMSIADPYHLRHNSLLALVGVYLMPGMTLIYQGTELDMTVTDVATRVKEHPEPINLPVYPKAARSLAYLASGENVNDKDLFMHTPMPWNGQGGFSDNITVKDYESYFAVLGTPDNVLLHNSIGAPYNYLSLIKSLIQLRGLESILFGKTNWEDSPKIGKDGYKPLIISRNAEGFAKVIIVHTENRSVEKGIPLNLLHVCAKAVVKVSYPHNPLLPLDAFSMEAVYIDTSRGETLHVFVCTE